LMGALDEYVQSFFPYRHAAIGDWYVDVSAGIFMSALLWAFLETKRRRPRTP
jgi:VanZ family protein